MALHLEKRPLESAARELREALHLSFRPLEEACSLLGTIGLFRMKSAEDEKQLAEELRALARQVKIQIGEAFSKADSPQSILRGLRDLERNLRAQAIN